MAGLIIRHGSPNWWTSPDIWVAEPGTGGSSVVASPVAGQTYDVWVRVTNSTSSPISTTLLPWLLQVVWAIPFGGSIPLSALPADDVLNSTAILDPVAAGASVKIRCATQWTPILENGGHECLIAWTYASNIAYPDEPYLVGNAGPGDNWSIAQHNLGVLPIGSHMRRFHYSFQICNGSREEQSFVVSARQAALAEIEPFLPGMPGGRSVLNRPGKVERLGIIASADAGDAELERAPAELIVKIAPMSCHRFTLIGVLPEGNALIHVTQSRDQRVVGGLSVLAMAEKKN